MTLIDMQEKIISKNSRSVYKDSLLFSEKVLVKRSKIHRWGIFAREKIKKYEIIEESPYFFIHYDEMDNSSSVLPYTYPYDYSNGYIVGMGYCGLYNHDFDSNVEYYVDGANEIMVHYASRDIEIGEELTLNYGEENAKHFVIDNPNNTLVTNQNK